MRVAHLPYYDDNPYQSLLMQAQRDAGHETLEGGGGGNFLRSALFRWKCDLVHFHWLHPYMVCPTLIGTWLRSMRFVVELFCLRLRGIKLIWTVHNAQSHDAKFPRTERLFRQIAAKVFHEIVCHSEAVAALAKTTFSVSDAKIVRCPHPNYIDVYPEQLVSQEQREKAGIEPEETVFLFVGRLAAYKGVDELIATFADLKLQKCRLIIAGKLVNESYGERIQKLTQDSESIEIRLEHIPDSELPSLMAIADAVVLPFRNVLNSGSAVLAMSFAKALIVPSQGSIPEIVPESPLVYTGSLEDALKWAVNNKQLLSEIGQTNYAKASDWTWVALAEACLCEDNVGD